MVYYECINNTVQFRKFEYLSELNLNYSEYCCAKRAIVWSDI